MALQCLGKHAEALAAFSAGKKYTILKKNMIMNNEKLIKMTVEGFLRF